MELWWNPWWNPRGTLPQARPGPPRSLSGAETPKLSAVGEKLRKHQINLAKNVGKIKRSSELIVCAVVSCLFFSLFLRCGVPECFVVASPKTNKQLLTNYKPNTLCKGRNNTRFASLDSSCYNAPLKAPFQVGYKAPRKAHCKAP